MSFLIKEYDIPFLGKVELLQATGYSASFNGKYYAKNKELGNFCVDCETPEELIEKTGAEIKKYFESRKISCETEISEKIAEKAGLIVILNSITFASKQTNFESWLKIHQTQNPLQLERQKSQ
jgi:hypothetical protein